MSWIMFCEHKKKEHKKVLTYNGSFIWAECCASCGAVVSATENPPNPLPKSMRTEND